MGNRGCNKIFLLYGSAFRISPAPYAFTKVCRTLVKLWRSNGVKIALFIDDGNGIAENRATADMHSDLVRKSLRRSGFVANSTKSTWEPCLELEWLGIIVNTNEGFSKLRFRRLESLDNALDSFFSTFPSISARRLSRISGTIISLSPVIGHISQIMTRNVVRVIAQQVSWDSNVDVSSDQKLLAEIRFWQSSSENLNYKQLFTDCSPQVLVYSDASKFACGAHIMVHKATAHRMWAEHEISKSSTWREIKAIHFSLLSFLPFLRQKKSILAYRQ